MKMKPFSVRTWVVFGFAVVFACRGALAGPDIHVNRVSIHENPRDGYMTGQTVSPFAYIRNEGDETAAEYTVNFYLSEDTEISAADYLLASTTRQNIAPKDTYGHVWAQSGTIPYVPATGPYYLGVIVTCEGDDNLENNTLYNPTRFRIIVLPPDLSFQFVAVAEPFYRPGESFSVSAQVCNSGRLNSAGYRVEFYVGETLVGTASRPGIVLPDLDTFNVTCTLPANITAGFYSLVARIICPDDSNPENDEAYSSSQIWVGPYPDLTLQTVSPPAGGQLPGAEITVYSQVKNIGDKVSAPYQVDYYISADAEITNTDYHMGHAELGALQGGAQHSFNTTCQLPSYLPEGDCYIGAIITCANDGRLANNERLAVEPIEIIHAEGFLCGQVRYENLTYDLFPVRYARLEVYGDNRTSSLADDRLIETTYTDDGGNYGAIVPEDERFGQKFYVKAFTEGVAGACPKATTSTVAQVKDDVFEQLYFLKSTSCTLPEHASLTINLTSPIQGGGAFAVYDSIVQGFLKAVEFFDLELDAPSVFWPSSDDGTYYYPGVGLFICQEDRFDRDVVMHEYGHYVAFSVGFGLGDVGDYPQHYWDRDLRKYPMSRSAEQARNLAFREAWGTLFSVVSQLEDKSYPSSGDTIYQDVDESSDYTFMIDLEWDTKSPKSPGQYYENMNCCALWDIFDEATIFEPRDTLTDPGLAKIWSVMCVSEPNDIIQFWDGWFDLHEDAPDMTRIFRDHEMPFQYNIHSPTIDGFETGDTGMLPWNDKGDLPWTISPDGPHEGLSCVRSGAIVAGETSTLETEVDCDDGWVKFWVKTDTACTPNKLQFCIDGVVQAEYSGSLNWRMVAFPVEAGAHRFTWNYVRGSSLGGDDNVIWIDNVELPIW